MQGYFKICNAVYWLSLAAWLAAMVTAAIAAAHVFGRLPEMAMTLDHFKAYPTEEHGTIAAGLVMADLFFTVDIVQFVAIPLTVITLAVQFLVFRLPLRRPANLIRCGCLLVAAGLFVYYAVGLAPSLNRQLREYWEAAEKGNVEEAVTHQKTLRLMHGPAELILQLNLLLVVGAVGASAAALSSTPVRPPSALEPPRLLSNP